ncbi:hypothetical protein ABPG77_001889 [Micractinium sp. CCAP 211/92]
MTPWRLDPLVEERLERCRELLVEPGGPHEGSADMRNYVEYADAIVAYHRLALDAQGRARPSLSHGQGLELCTLFCRAISRHPLLSLGIDPRADRLLADVGRMLPTDEVCGMLLSMGTRVAGLTSPMPHRDYENKLQLAESIEKLATELMPEEAARLPEWLAEQGSRQTVTVTELRRLAQYRVVKAALNLLEEARAADRPLPAPLLRQAVASSAALVALAPDWPALPAAAGGGIPAAHYWAGQGAVDMAMALMAGAEGRRFEVQRVQALLEECEQEFKLSRAWAAASYKRTMADVREAQASLRDMVARGPRGATHLPAELDICWGGAPTVMGGARCALCGLDAVELKKCTACKSVAYCSRECQVKHWRQPGGHKPECKALAAQRAASKS